MKKIRALISVITLTVILGGCANPIELTLDNDTYCISDKNKGVLKRVTIQKIDSTEQVVCQTMISKSIDANGLSTICLFSDNSGYDKYEQCQLEIGFYYRVVAQNIGHADTLGFRMK